MAIKDSIDFSTFSTSEQGFELFGNSIRKSFKYDSYGDRTRFNAQVISNPLPVSPKDIKFFVGSSKKKEGEDVSKLSKFVYRARILGENSPHELLPDPCDSTYASDPEQALKVIAMHTLFVSNVEDGNPSSLPRIGSIVEVQLTKNVFGYNLQYGKHINVVTNPDTEPKGIADCDSLTSIMAKATSGSPSGGSYTGPVTVGDNLTDRGVSYTKHFDETAPALHYPANGPICSHFGMRKIFGKWSFHTGIDISNVVGVEVRAALDGKVVFAGGKTIGKADCKDVKTAGGSTKCRGGAGNFIMLKHVTSNGTYITKYMHLQEDGFLVKSGQAVKKGQPIGKMGNTGSSTGSHLHFEYRKQGEKGPILNPSFHFEETFEDSKNKKNIEQSTGKLQAEKTPVAEPLEAVGSEGVQETEPTGAETSTTPE